MDSQIKLLSLNIEGDKHLDRIFPFLKSQAPDIICLQEVLGKDVELVKKTLQMEGQYFPTTFMASENPGGLTPGNQWGVLILIKSEPERVFHHTYVGIDGKVPVFRNDFLNSTNRVLVGVEYQNTDATYRIFTTHFTWTPDGEPDQLQRDNLKSLLQILDNYDDFVLCGDFNAPRGKEIWETLAQKYTDNIPEDITTTIDQNLHKAKGLQLVVDGLFSTPQYRVREVQVVDGVSDHMAIVAYITK